VGPLDHKFLSSRGERLNLFLKDKREKRPDA